MINYSIRDNIHICIIHTNRKPINLALLELSENGELELLERKWWNSDKPCAKIQHVNLNFQI